MCGGEVKLVWIGSMDGKKRGIKTDLDFPEASTLKNIST